MEGFLKAQGPGHVPSGAIRPLPPRDDQAPASPVDGADLSPEAIEKAIDAWRLGMRERIQAAVDPAAIAALADEASRRLAEPGLPPGAQATLHMVVSRAYGRLVQLGVDKKSNGRKAFDAGTRAVRLAPTKTLVAENYGRTLLSFAELNWASRKIVTLALHIDLDEEIRKSLGWLAASPDAAMAQVVRVRLARRLDDKGERKRAEAALAAIGGRDPEAVAAAEAELAADKRRAEAAKPGD